MIEKLVNLIKNNHSQYKIDLFEDRDSSINKDQKIIYSLR
jgi:hypothetical protein